MLQLNVRVLLGQAGNALACQQIQRRDEAGSGLARLDDLFKKAGLGRVKGSGLGIGVLLHQRRALGKRVLHRGELLVPHNGHRRLRR